MNKKEEVLDLFRRLASAEENHVTTTHRQVLAKKIRFLVARDGDAALRDANDKLSEVMNEKRALEHEGAEMARKLTAATEALNKEKGDNAGLRTRCNDLIDIKEKAEVAGRKLEGDIAKIRSAIGTVKMKEILEGGK